MPVSVIATKYYGLDLVLLVTSVSVVVVLVVVHYNIILQIVGYILHEIYTRSTYLTLLN